MTAEVRTQGADPGLYVLVGMLRWHSIGADAEQIRHRFGRAAIGISEMLRCAKEFGLKARERVINWDRLATVPLPAIAALRDGGYLLLGKVADGKVLVARPHTARPVLLNRAELEAIWDGRVVLMTRRASLTELSRRFDINWFLGAIHSQIPPSAV
jgi:ATP-binding cassette, subfamily B, bacterial HlyB/CyaB